MQTRPETIDFLNNSLSDGGFLQSQEWRVFQEGFGRKTFHFESDGVWANAIKHRLPLAGAYWYMPRGPVVGNGISDIIKENFLRDVAEKARDHGAGWIRVEPEHSYELGAWEKLGYRVKKSPHDVQPKEIFVVSLKESEDEILAKMKSKTRYNIRLAERKGVKIFTSRDPIHIGVFCDLVDITAKRDGIVPHPRAYYRTMLETLPEERMKLYFAEYEGKIVAASTLATFGKYATYVHGASGNEYREVMAPYLLQWRQMQDAKQAECEYYDFGGVNCDGSKTSWQGITRFKRGFDEKGESLVLPGSYDIVISSFRYGLYRLLERVKHWLH